MPAALTVLAGVAAAADWIAVSRRNRRAEYVLKPLALVLLIGVALALREQAPALRWGLTLAALASSLAGDVALMLPADLFLPGLAAFLVGHLTYVASFAVTPPRPAALAVAAVAAAAVAAPVYLRLLRGMVSSGAARRMAVPVGLYVVAVAGMAASALATLATPGWTGTRSALAIAGAVLFMGSDALIGWNRFVRPLPWAPVAIMASYHLAQGALVWALLGAV